MIFELNLPTLPVWPSTQIFMKNQDFFRKFLFSKNINLDDNYSEGEGRGMSRNDFPHKKTQNPDMIFTEGTVFKFQRSNHGCEC